MKKKIIILTIIISTFLKINAQNITIKTVDAKNKPVAGAIILFDDVRQGRWTNAKGIFKTSYKNSPKIISAFHANIGITKVKFKGDKKIIIKILKGNDLNVLNNSPKQKSLNTNQFNTIYDYLRGNVPGVTVTANNVINIRGYSSINGSMVPLFVLNGNYIDQDTFGLIPPLDIKSITVLKGPETSRYGLRGSNGVIEVETN